MWLKRLIKNVTTVKEKTNILRLYVLCSLIGLLHSIMRYYGKR